MKKIIPLIFTLSLLFNACKEETKKDKSTKVELDFNIEKVIIVNIQGTSITYFKTKITNPSNFSVILMDNSLSEYYPHITNLKREGFFLQNIKTDSIIPLGIDNYHFYELGLKTNGYYYIGGKDLEHSYDMKDSLLLKSDILNYRMTYNGETLDLKNIKKNKYISTGNFERFLTNKNKYIPYKNKLMINIPHDNLKLIYLNEMPIYKKDWDKL